MFFQGQVWLVCNYQFCCLILCRSNVRSAFQAYLGYLFVSFIFVLSTLLICNILLLQRVNFGFQRIIDFFKFVNLAFIVRNRNQKFTICLLSIDELVDNFFCDFLGLPFLELLFNFILFGFCLINFSLFLIFFKFFLL